MAMAKKQKHQKISLLTTVLVGLGCVITFWVLFAQYTGIHDAVQEYFSSVVTASQATAPCNKQPGRRSVQEWEECYPVDR